MAAADDDLTLIPRSVRDKLDRVGIKLHLAEWQQLSQVERRQLVERHCVSAAEVECYRAALDSLVRARTGRAPQCLRR